MARSMSLDSRTLSMADQIMVRDVLRDTIPNGPLFKISAADHMALVELPDSGRLVVLVWKDTSYAAWYYTPSLAEVLRLAKIAVRNWWHHTWERRKPWR